MGLSSNTRLLTITARLTSNEYESQQLTNAKLRLATQSQEASDEYLKALNQQSYSFVTYDNTGNPVYASLSANTIYQYNDSKNQYILSNANGVALISSTDAQNYEKSGTLKAFLGCYGLNEEYIDGSKVPDGGFTEVEDSLAYYMTKMNDYVDASGKTKWESFVNDRIMSGAPDYADWYLYNEKYLTEYREAHSQYQTLIELSNSDGSVDRSEIYEKRNQLNAAYKLLLQYATYSSYLELRAISGPDDSSHPYGFSSDPILTSTSRTVGGTTLQWVDYEYNSSDPELNEAVKEFTEYKNHVANYNALLERLKIDPDDAYKYEDKTKAQWYTNLWYRINGDSTVKSESGNYKVLETELASSSTWIRDALSQGIINIEQASYVNEPSIFPDENNPLVRKLTGINWEAKIMTSCTDIVQKDDDARLSRAEALYKKRTAEINEKDERFQRKISILNTQHNALQTEYDSVKSALEKNISRSYKTFSG